MHFVVAVKYTGDIKEYEAQVEKQLEPFWQDLEVKPFVFKNTEVAKEEFKQFLKENPDALMSFEEWAEEQCCKVDADKNLIAEWNNQARWDWFSIGGRWNGLLKSKAKGVKHKQFGDKHEAGYDVLRIGDIDLEKIKTSEPKSYLNNIKKIGDAFHGIVKEDANSPMGYTWIDADDYKSRADYDKAVGTFFDDKDAILIVVDCHN